MEETRYQSVFQTSMAGRGTFAVYMLASLAGVVFVAIPVALLGLQSRGELGWASVLGAGACALVCTAFAIMAGLRTFGSGQRVSTTADGFKYDGVFKVERIRWSEVESFRMSNGEFIARMTVQTKPEARGGARKIAMDVGGLTPPAAELMKVFAEATGIALPAAKNAKAAKK